MPVEFTKMIGPLIWTAVIVFILYRRVRSLGRQRLRPTRLIVRITVLTLVCAMVLFSAFITLTGLAYAALGGSLGVGIAVYALRHTKFEATPEGTFYTPHLYIGLAVTGLLIARMIYRFTQIYQATQNAPTMAKQDPFASMASSPLTVGVLLLTAGYYVAFYAGVLIETRRLPEANDAIPSTGEA